MMIRHCDRCGAEVFRDPTSKVQQLGARMHGVDAESRGLWELCEACTVELRHWLEGMAEVRKGRLGE